MRTLMTASCVLAFAAALAAQDKKPARTLNISGSVADEALAEKAPKSGVIVTAKGLDALAAAWGLKEVPKVDFDKELVVVATTRGGSITMTPVVKDGDLKVVAISTRDLRPGFRYVMLSAKRDGVKTVNGKELPKE